jgi:hypothetical protein
LFTRDAPGLLRECPDHHPKPAEPAASKPEARQASGPGTQVPGHFFLSAAAASHLHPSNRAQLLLFPSRRMRDSTFTASSKLLEEKMELVRMIKMVLWSFFGVRKSAAHALDLENVNFSLLPFVAVALALMIGAFILGVVLLVAHSTGSAQGF